MKPLHNVFNGCPRAQKFKSALSIVYADLLSTDGGRKPVGGTSCCDSDWLAGTTGGDMGSGSVALVRDVVSSSLLYAAAIRFN